jgi:hypothetical protein
MYTFDEIWKEIDGNNKSQIGDIVEALQEKMDELYKAQNFEALTKRHSFAQVQYGIQNMSYFHDLEESPLWKAARAKGREMVLKEISELPITDNVTEALVLEMPLVNDREEVIKVVMEDLEKHTWNILREDVFTFLKQHYDFYNIVCRNPVEETVLKVIKTLLITDNAVEAADDAKLYLLDDFKEIKTVIREDIKKFCIGNLEILKTDIRKDDDVVSRLEKNRIGERLDVFCVSIISRGGKRRILKTQSRMMGRPVL